MYLRIKGIGKRLGLRDNLVSKNPKYANDATKLVNLWLVSVQSLSLQRKVVLPQTNKKKTSIYSPTYCLKFTDKKHNIASYN
jgi:hypothetical protein